MAVTRGNLLSLGNKNASCRAADRDTQPSGGQWLRVPPRGAAPHRWRPLLSFVLIGFTILAICRLGPGPGGLNSLSDGTSEEILYRQALFPSLNDSVIFKRLLLQKIGPNAARINIADPGTGELKAWFANNQERFRRPPRVTFRQLYFSTNINGQSARDTALQVLESVSREADSPLASLADSSMFRHYYQDRTKRDIESVFGPGFTKALFEQQPGSWRGPIASGGGWHLVWIDLFQGGRVPPFEKVESEVRLQWMAAHRHQ